MPLPRDQLKELADVRMSEAILLLEASLPCGAYHLAGVAIELGLKACVARQFSEHAIPDLKFVQKIYSHDIEILVGVADLKTQLAEKAKAEAAFSVNWEIVRNWKIDSRYEIIDLAQAKSFLKAAADQDSGFFPWIRTHW